MSYAVALVHKTVQLLKGQHGLSALAIFIFLGVTAGIPGCGGGSSTPPAPSGLSYSQSAIVATMNQAISSDMPTVTGTVTLYAVSPALPAGLSLRNLLKLAALQRVS